ncbi:LPXTG cell wall anchor domain-containing protein [Dyadobacter sp. Leaf189]|uniref:LPXTG cell wall anchor domain-containing protein n=1 Tax=Dyadobacter sp. Leaf189 TaxID=1736295 RepID=UPI0006F7B95D|nr:LPXTG cell wall anchor domain-containing protein [Dyadobacter sp. Leaf189]KQS33928.1 hypothetical protein ASG33_07795 [Dyadobacter sp. Leaf189]
MDWTLTLIGLIIIGFGGYIWRFKRVNLLNNVPKGARLIDKDKAARLGGSYLVLIGICFVVFGYVLANLPDETIIIIVACFISVNMVVVVSYLVAQSRNMK